VINVVMNVKNIMMNMESIVMNVVITVGIINISLMFQGICC
jgi:hypothetical protein